MIGDYFYNKTIRKTVAVFGSLFNDIVVRRQSGDKILNTIKVPLAYGPIEKFLARIDEIDKLEGQAIAIKLPRMSFEIDDISYDPTQKLNRMNDRVFDATDILKRKIIKQSVPYNITMSLNVMARTQDDALQIIEQILPTFAPEYTVTVKEFEGPGSKTDVPIILTGTSFSNEYEGDFANTRQLIVYTMTFSVKIKFSGRVEDKKIINDVDIDLFNYTGSLTDSDSDGFLEEISVTADSDSGPITTLILDSDDGI
jgi:hypothetical protein|tara:strand:- start:251 stop:1015 length:765 start_codon:yes stop_codon:yes gene_type:complete